MRYSLLLCCLMALLLCSCASSREQRHAQKCPWPEKNAPPELLVAADDLLAFQSVMSRAPQDLAELDKTNLSSNGAYANRAYAYHPNGIGVLSEGWRVLIADDRVRKRGFIWCVLRPPTRSSRLSGLRVAMVSLAELGEAATMAGRGSATESLKIIE